MPDAHAPDLVAGVLDGQVAPTARMLTLVERRAPELDEHLQQLYRAGRSAHVIGVTGPAGSGKSTLVSSLALEYRRRGKTVGILAVDPSSVFTGGAILGDRIRMGGLSGDSGIFIRSMATRGAMGGLARAALDSVTVLEASGKDVVIVETVGVGQAEVDIVGLAHTVAVVSVPGLGDSVQALKAGLLEIADVHIVNKSDREGAQRTASELKEMLRLSKRQVGQWNVPVQLASSAKEEGLPELIDAFDRHREWMLRTGELERRLRRNAAARIRWAANDLVARRMTDRDASFSDSVDLVLEHASDPLTEARRLIDALH
ncbi:MAG: methylmalonyl Co-A mutase-associated GTPase MeaB [Actinomycetota bacterium]|nr:methylmalonyl Co-A mutase-associated GTPase MeaB [Actinomycetota bacterium]